MQPQHPLAHRLAPPAPKIIPGLVLPDLMWESSALRSDSSTPTESVLCPTRMRSPLAPRLMMTVLQAPINLPSSVNSSTCLQISTLFGTEGRMRPRKGQFRVRLRVKWRFGVRRGEWSYSRCGENAHSLVTAEPPHSSLRTRSKNMGMSSDSSLA